MPVYSRGGDAGCNAGSNSYRFTPLDVLTCVGIIVPPVVSFKILLLGSAAMAHLKITDASGRQWQFSFLPNVACTIGRAPDNSVVLDDPRASRYHAHVNPIRERQISRSSTAP